MKFRLRKRLADDTDSYEREEVEKYLDYLIEQERVIEVENIWIEPDQLLRPFVCDDRLCIPDAQGKIRGRKRKMCSCCVDYTPRLSTDERDRIERILPGMFKRFPDLNEVIQQAGGYYEWDENYDRMMNKRFDDLCVFQFPDDEEIGFHGCMIHTYCLEKKLSPHLYKPSACVMFPLFLLDIGGDDGSMLITAHNEEVMNVGEDEDNYHKVGCEHPNEIAREPLYVAMKDTLIYMFGAEAWKSMDRALRQYRKERDERDAD